ncbi:carotenoid biosynthesis protein [Paenibacillus sp. FJAT-26967]|uniref:carotenoid biosynthesis protein n=1 Tax=Paenibacillus sp. FJAT-26967 TaxID=1729690 RepID=UPI0008397681|nr:carotenoid biosynthesis protein [Paenibacillus sp. FJAT-26967]
MLKGSLILYCFWFACGFILLVMDILPPWLEWANSVYLMLGGLTALLWTARMAGIRKSIRFLVLCGGLSFFSEWFGSHTGLWFGSYAYTGRFAPLVLGVPLAIPLAWCMILVIAKWFVRGQGTSAAIAAGGIAVLIDALLDPVAVQQQYWNWSTAGSFSFHGVPWTNFVCWWITASVIYALTMRWSLPESPSCHPTGTTAYPHRRTDWMFQAPLVLFLTLELLFLALGFSYGLWSAVILNAFFSFLLLAWRTRVSYLSKTTATHSRT